MVEGRKTVGELLDSEIELQALILTEEAVERHPEMAQVDAVFADPKQFKSLSLQSSPDGCMAIAQIPDAQIEWDFQRGIYCESINDPGNLGAIIRMADWFGLNMVCVSPDSVDVYSPKVVQSARGSLFRTKVIAGVGIDDLKRMQSNGVKLYAAEMKGESVKTFDAADKWLLMMGSESHGHKKEVLEISDSQITIDRAPKSVQIDSLNVGQAAAILTHQLSRF